MADTTVKTSISLFHPKIKIQLEKLPKWLVLVFQTGMDCNNEAILLGKL